MDWDKDIGLLLIDILMLSICILMYKKKTILGTYGKYMFAAMVVTFLIDILLYFIAMQKNIPGAYNQYIYIYGQCGIFFLLLFLMYQNLTKDKILQKIAKIITITFVVSFIFQIFHENESIKLLQNILYFNVFFLLSAITLFLLDTFKTDLIFISLIGFIVGVFWYWANKGYYYWNINFIGYGIIFVGLFKAKKLD
jgi:branched-subunit amino acid transport protein AzlD